MPGHGTFVCSGLVETLPPSTEIHHHWHSLRRPYYNPHRLLIPIVDFLMLAVRWDELSHHAKKGNKSVAVVQYEQGTHSKRRWWWYDRNETLTAQSPGFRS